MKYTCIPLLAQTFIVTNLQLSSEGKWYRPVVNLKPWYYKNFYMIDRISKGYKDYYEFMSLKQITLFQSFNSLLDDDEVWIFQ